MVNDGTTTGAPELPTGWRFKVGIALFALMILAWLLIPIEAALGMSAAYYRRHHCRDRNRQQGHPPGCHCRDGKAGLPGAEGEAPSTNILRQRRGQSDAIPDRPRDVLSAIPARLA